MLLALSLHSCLLSSLFLFFFFSSYFVNEQLRPNSLVGQYEYRITLLKLLCYIHVIDENTKKTRFELYFPLSYLIIIWSGVSLVIAFLLK